MGKMPLLEKTFLCGDKKLNVRIWNSPEWDFEQFSRSHQIMFQLIGCYLSKLAPALLHNGHIDIAYWHDDDSPITLYNENPHNRVILLNVKESYWCQYVYQLAHELTHYFIGGTKDEHNNWFYESLAELASNYFLLEMSRIFSTYGDSYAAKFSSYQKTTELSKSNDIASPSEWLKSHEADLCQNKTNRALNAEAAKLLLPYFQSKPDIWNILLFAPHETCSLSELLGDWKAAIEDLELYHHQYLSSHIARFQKLFSV